MRNRPTRFLLPLVLLLGMACHVNGTWEDDRGNWARAFGAGLPSRMIKVRHSWYWREGVMESKEAFFFALSASPTTVMFLREGSGMDQVAPADLPAKMKHFCKPAPKWFANGDLSRYDAWATRAPVDNLLLQDRVTGDVFVYSCRE